jgi:hypothetical protein
VLKLDGERATARLASYDLERALGSVRLEP